MDKDISKKSVAVLLVLAIILSVFLTLAVLKDSLNFGSNSKEQKSPALAQTAEIRLTVIPPEEVETEGNVNTP